MNNKMFLLKQNSFGESPPIPSKLLNGDWKSKYDKTNVINTKQSATKTTSVLKKTGCKVPGLKKSDIKLEKNQPTLLSKFGFQKR